MSEKDVYLPVAVTVEDGRVTGAFIDFEGMPWTEWTSDNAYNDEEDWHRDDDALDVAAEWLETIVKAAAENLT